jgi:phosphate starvation-inducible PhoH-like protein
MAKQTERYPEEFITALDSPVHDHLTTLEALTGAKIIIHGDEIQAQGRKEQTDDARRRIGHIFHQWKTSGEIMGADLRVDKPVKGDVLWRTEGSNTAIVPRNQAQSDYIHQLDTNTVTVCSGPAGTGKTFLAVCHAVRELQRHRSVNRIIITRPVVESGENLGFLPGTLEEKIDPYMRPIFDALIECLGPERVKQMLETKTIELSPLAYMRGRTLSDAYIILDESQNTSPEQMRMFLTRLGETSRMVITGDTQQSDLGKKLNGLVDILTRLEKKPVDGIGITKFTRADVVRHPIVRDVLELYED